MPSDLFTTSYLGSFAGLVAATYLLVQFFKEPIKQHLNDWWVRLLAVGFALVIQLFVLYVDEHFVVETIGLAVLNSFLIAISAAGMHDLSRTSTSAEPNTNAQIASTEMITQSQVPDANAQAVIPQKVVISETTTKDEPHAGSTEALQTTTNTQTQAS
ncbi:hypothetical protein ACHOLT_01260 [Desulfitobacterium sp. Sab5]|uniref:hypothetical protein n=1 Tax=Desulfitobacterium nosdiversum TaxID=3375356 RepID=UPI003CF99264